MKRLLSFISALAMVTAVCTSCGYVDNDADTAESQAKIIPNVEAEVEADPGDDHEQPGDEDIIRMQSCTTSINNSEYPEITAVTFTGECTGDIKDLAHVRSYTSHVLHNGLVGRVGTPVMVEFDENISQTGIAFEYNTDELRGIPSKNLIILHYDEENGSYDTVEGFSLDEAECTVSAGISENGVYILADAYQWYGCRGYDVSEYEYENDKAEYATDWERQGRTGSIMKLADKEWAMENAPEFHVSNAEELASAVWYVNGVSEDGVVAVYLEDDIDLTGYDWKPMGWTNTGIKHQFSGLVDGQGHTINGMTIKAGYEDTGFIGYGLYVSVVDITFTNANVSATGCTGIVGGQLYMCGEWSNVHTQGKVSGGNDDYGAIVGRETDITFKNCTSDVTVDGKPFEYLSYRQKREDDVEIVETFHLTMDDDHTVTRDEHEGFTNLGWMIKYNDVEVLDRNAENELSYQYFGNSPGKYTIYLTAYINGTYIRVSNIIEYNL